MIVHSGESLLLLYSKVLGAFCCVELEDRVTGITLLKMAVPELGFRAQPI